MIVEKCDDVVVMIHDDDYIHVDVQRGMCRFGKDSKGCWMVDIEDIDKANSNRSKHVTVDDETYCDVQQFKNSVLKFKSSCVRDEEPIRINCQLVGHRCQVKPSKAK